MKYSILGILEEWNKSLGLSAVSRMQSHWTKERSENDHSTFTFSFKPNPKAWTGFWLQCLLPLLRRLWKRRPVIINHLSKCLLRGMKHLGVIWIGIGCARCRPPYNANSGKQNIGIKGCCFFIGWILAFKSEPQSHWILGITGSPLQTPCLSVDDKVFRNSILHSK